MGWHHPPANAASVPAFVVDSCYSPCGGGGLDTRSGGAQAKAQLGGTGYAASETSGVTASFVQSWVVSGNTAILLMLGHGGPGQMTTAYGTQWTYLSATGSVGSCSYPNACLPTGGPGSFPRVRLMVFQGCRTALYYGGHSSTPYNLLDEAYFALGVDSVVGFKNDIDYSPTTSTAWDYKFFNTLRAGNRVDWSLSQARIYVGSQNGGNYGGYDSYDYWGGSTVIKPPQWGTP